MEMIDRQAAIDLWEKYHPTISVDAMQYDAELRQLPPAQPERKKRRWIVYYECPKCGEITKDFTEYCPFCNADMRGEKDG